MTNFEKLTATKTGACPLPSIVADFRSTVGHGISKKVLQQMSFAGLRLLPARREAERSGLVAWLES